MPKSWACTDQQWAALELYLEHTSIREEGALAHPASFRHIPKLFAFASAYSHAHVRTLCSLTGACVQTWEGAPRVEGFSHSLDLSDVARLAKQQLLPRRGTRKVVNTPAPRAVSCTRYAVRMRF